MLRSGCPDRQRRDASGGNYWQLDPDYAIGISPNYPEGTALSFTIEITYSELVYLPPNLTKSVDFGWG